MDRGGGPASDGGQSKSRMCWSEIAKLLPGRTEEALVHRYKLNERLVLAAAQAEPDDSSKRPRHDSVNEDLYCMHGQCIPLTEIEDVD